MLDRNFLLDVLGKKGFSLRWCHWIKGCVETTNFSVFINGQPRGKMLAHRGPRQECPLLPFLFTSIGDAFSCLVHFEAGGSNSSAARR